MPRVAWYHLLAVGALVVVPAASRVRTLDPYLNGGGRNLGAYGNLVGSGVRQHDGWRTVSFETSEVTAPDVAVSPDGQWLVFTMLGKLFRLPARGGEAEQLTFGPYYDADPAISPDGKLIAFQSDRDGSEGNIFLLDLASLEIRQLTRETWADSPAWAPDGQSLVYLRPERRFRPWNLADPEPRRPALVRRVGLAGGEPQTVRRLGDVTSPFFLSDGRIGWGVIERDSISRAWTTRIEVSGERGEVSTLRVINGVSDAIVASPKADGLYARTANRPYAGQVSHELHLLFAPVPGARERELMDVSGENSRFAVHPNNTALYLGNLGHLWKVGLPNGRREVVPLRARVELVIREATVAPIWTPPEPGSTGPLRTIWQPRLSPDGRTLVFGALGRLWRQSLAGGSAQRLIEAEVNQWYPAFSPDGSQLAFARDSQNNEVVQILDLKSGGTRTVASDTTGCGFEYLTWSAHGELVAATGCVHDVIAIDPRAATVRLLAKTSGWEPYPQVSANGRTLYFQAEFPVGKAAWYRLPLDGTAPPEALLPASLNGIEMASQGSWVARAIPNHPGIELVPLGPPGTSLRLRLIATADGRDFSFTPDGSAILYVEGQTLWREPVTGGQRKEVPIRLTPRVPIPPPVLLQGIRVLDLAAGRFGTETSLLIEGGWIRWIGRPEGHELPPGTMRVDAAGRFAIPGLFEMHGHRGGCGGAALLSYGITSVRNMGGRLEQQNAYADGGDFTSAPLPRCFYSGQILEGLHGRNEGWGFVHARDEADARSLVRQWKSRGATFLKVYDKLPWPLQRAVADEARRVGLPITAHGQWIEEAVKGVTLGFASLSHWRRFHDDAIQMFAVAKIDWDPTLLFGVEVRYRDDPERYRVESSLGVMATFGDLALRGAWAEQLRSAGAAYRRGVTFVPGTDAGGPTQGLALQLELEFFAEAGIAPLDVLRFATRESARMVGAGNQLGSLEAGKLADLILLDANPLENIKNTQKIWRVFKGGWQFDPKVLRPGTQ